MIVDIKFMNGEAYLLKTHTLSLSNFEQQLANIEYDSVYKNYKVKDKAGVEKAHFPAVNIVFYRSIFESGTVLVPMQLVDEYFKYYKDTINVTNGNVYYLNKRYSYPAVVGRLLRTYPSLIRDYDFYLKLLESHSFEQVIYSCKMDLNGADITVRSKGKEYIISLFTDTDSAKYYKKQKNNVRHSYGTNEIQLPLLFNNATKCGDFFVYDDRHIEEIKEHIEKSNQ